jgi:cytochrome P450
MAPIKKRAKGASSDSVLGKILKDFANDEEVFEEFSTIFGAAATTVHALSWLGHILGRHPKVMEKLIAEILANGESTTLEDLEQLTYLTAVIREGIRLYPPAPLMLRTPAEGVFEEKIEAIFIPIWLLNRNPLFWENPLEFMPERWIVTSSDGQKRLKNIDQYIPFGDGSRICIGMRFSMIESRIILIEMLKRFTWDSWDQKTPKAKTDILTRPAKDIYLNIKKRNL